MSTAHRCQPPDLSTWPDLDDDWTCPECGQDWFVDLRTCRACMLSPGPAWAEYGDGDGTFPLVTAPRGGIQFHRPGAG